MALMNVGKRPANEQIDRFYVTVDEIFSDEAATYLREFDAPTMNGLGRGRFQEIHVLRDSYVGSWFYNLGPSRLFTAPEFQIVGGSFRDHRQDIETVASIRDYAISHVNVKAFSGVMRGFRDDNRCTATGRGGIRPNRSNTIVF